MTVWKAGAKRYCYIAFPQMAHWFKNRFYWKYFQVAMWISVFLLHYSGYFFSSQKVYWINLWLIESNHKQFIFWTEQSRKKFDFLRLLTHFSVGEFLHQVTRCGYRSRLLCWRQWSCGQAAVPTSLTESCECRHGSLGRTGTQGAVVVAHNGWCVWPIRLYDNWCGGILKRPIGSWDDHHAVSVGHDVHMWLGRMNAIYYWWRWRGIGHFKIEFQRKMDMSWMLKLSVNEQWKWI